MRASRHEAAVDRLRRDPAAAGLREAGRDRRDDRLWRVLPVDARRGGRHGLLGHVPEPARGHAVCARRPLPPARAGAAPLQLRGAVVGLRHARDRDERAVRRAPHDAVDADERPLPGERAAVGAPAGREGCSARAPALDRSVHGRRRGAVVAGRRCRSPTSCSRSTSPRRRSRAPAPVLGNRRMRTSMRRSASKLFAINVPPARSASCWPSRRGRGTGGREGLEPAARWFEVAKWQALAARQVAAELGLAHIWSWGWGTYNSDGADADKPGAACVWLWARDRSLCDAPATARQRRSTTDLREGQIDLAGGRALRLRRRGRHDERDRRAGPRHRRGGGRAVRALRAARGEPGGGRSGARTCSQPSARSSASASAAARRVPRRAHARTCVGRGRARRPRATSSAGRRCRRDSPRRADGAEIETFYADVRSRARPGGARSHPRRRGSRAAAASCSRTVAPPRLFIAPHESRHDRLVAGGLAAGTRRSATPQPLGVLPLDAARPAIRRALRAAARPTATTLDGAP